MKISLTEIMDVSNSNEDVAYQNFWDALWSGNSIQYFDVISKYVPEFAKLRGVPQNPKWHPEGDCDIHVCLVIDNLAHLKDKTLSMAAVFHDIGKPYTTKINPKTGQPTAPGHEDVSVTFVDKYKDFIESSGADFQSVRDIVANHMRMHQYNSGDLKNPAKRERMEKSPSFGNLGIFAQADHDMPLKK